MSSEFEENEQEIEVVRYIVHEDYYKDITGGWFYLFIVFVGSVFTLLREQCMTTITEIK